MALTKFGTFTFLHASQADDLSLTLSAAQIKSAFDSQASEIKTYLNDTLTGEIDTLASGKLAKAGDTATGIITAYSNTSYTTKQVRNIIISTADAVLADMANGDIWIKV